MMPILLRRKLQLREVNNLYKIKKLGSGRVRIRKGTTYREDKRLMNYTTVFQEQWAEKVNFPLGPETQGERKGERKEPFNKGCVQSAFIQKDAKF